MDLLQTFKQYLATQKSGASPATVKNYLADVSRFLRWYEFVYKEPFNLKYIPSDIIKRYKNASVSSPDINNVDRNIATPPISERSFARHLASIRKFFVFLKESYGVTADPFSSTSLLPRPTDDDRWHFSEYKSHLFVRRASPHTIKNYINDVRLFLEWLETVTLSVPDMDSGKPTIFQKITSQSLKEYRNRLLSDGKFSPLSINRKLSSLRSYIYWLQSSGYIAKEISLKIASVSNVPDGLIDDGAVKNLLSLQDDLDYYTHPQDVQTGANLYSSFGPLRFMQKVGFGLGRLSDFFLIGPISRLAENFEFGIFKLTGKSLFVSLHKARSANKSAETMIDTAITQGIGTGEEAALITDAIPTVKNLSKTFYAPFSISTSGMPFFKRLWFGLKYQRPEWYKMYHSKRIVHYIHFGILFFYIIGLSGMIYIISERGYSYQLPIIAASQTDPPKLLSFAGRLTSDQHVPITATSTLRFSLYNSRESSGSALLWQEVRTVKPDANGNFSLSLGQQVPIPATLLVKNPNLFIGVTLGSSNEMRPREQIATSGLATSAQSIAGLQPITLSGATKNTLLALNSAGNLAIGGSGPTFEASEGIFTLSGQAVLLTSNIGSDGNITLSPDGNGGIDVQGALVNTTENNSMSNAPGSVQVDDTLAVLASSSAVAALTLQQDGSGPLISASASGSTKFSLDNFGNGFFGGNLAIGGDSLTTNNTSFTIFPENAFNLNIGSSATALNLGATAGTTTVRNTLQVSGNTILGDSTGDTVTINGMIVPAGNSSQDIGSSSASFNNAYLTNLFLTPSATVSGFLRRDSGNISFVNSSDSLLIGSSNPSTALIKLSATSGQSSYINSGKLGIGTTAPLTDQLHVFGDIRVGTTLTDGCLKRYDGNAIAGTCSSDRRLKKNITPISDVLEKLRALEPVTYEMRADEFPEYGFGTGTSYGLIAQDVERLFPELVETDRNGYKMVKYGPELSMLTLAGVKELSLQVNQLHSSLSLLQQTVPVSPSGDVIIAQDSDGDYTVKTDKGTFLTTTAAYLKIVSATISAGMVSAKEGAFDTLAIATENVSIAGLGIREYIQTVIDDYFANGETKVASIGKIQTDIISPLATDAQFGLALDSKGITLKNGTSASASAVARLDNQGNASFSGQLSASSIQSSDASISGTLRAGKIIAADIEGLDDKIATLAGQQIASPSANQIINNIYNIYTTASESAGSNKTHGTNGTYETNWTASESANVMTSFPSVSFAPSSYADIASISASFAYVPHLSADFATVNQGLMVFGATSLSDVSVAGQLSVSGKLILADNTINVLGETLEIQPLRQGNISFMGGMVRINTSGDVQFNGDATFAKNIRVNGELVASFIAPVPAKDLVIKLGHEAKNTSTPSGELLNTELQIQNASGSGILAINNVGDLIASGAGRFKDIATGSLNIVRGVSADTSAMDTIASSSAGVSVITPGYTSRTIYSDYVTRDSLIYISPRSKTTFAVPYLARQTETDPVKGIKSSFTVQIPKPMTEEVSFNWWIIN